MGVVEDMLEIEKQYATRFLQPAGQTGVSGVWSWDSKGQWHFFFPGDPTPGQDGKPTSWSNLAPEQPNTSGQLPGFFTPQPIEGPPTYDGGMKDIGMGDPTKSIFNSTGALIGGISLPLLILLMSRGRMDNSLLLLLMLSGGITGAGIGGSIFNSPVPSLGTIPGSGPGGFFDNLWPDAVPNPLKFLWDLSKGIGNILQLK